jgi:hypothetical protein
MELEGVVHNGVIVLDDAESLPEGTRVRVSPQSEKSKPSPAKSRTFGERYAQFKGAAAGLPPDLAEQHSHPKFDEAALDAARRKMTDHFARPDCEFAVGSPDSREQRNARR